MQALHISVHQDVAFLGFHLSIKHTDTSPVPFAMHRSECVCGETKKAIKELNLLVIKCHGVKWQSSRSIMMVSRNSGGHWCDYMEGCDWPLKRVNRTTDGKLRAACVCQSAECGRMSTDEYHEWSKANDTMFGLLAGSVGKVTLHIFTFQIQSVTSVTYHLPLVSFASLFSAHLHCPIKL